MPHAPHFAERFRSREAREELQLLTIDRDFGEGVGARVKRALAENIREKLEESDHLGAASDASRYVLLFGERCWGKEDDAAMRQALEEEAGGGANAYASHSAALVHLRVLFGRGRWSEEVERRIRRERREVIDALIRHRRYDDAAWRAADFSALSGEPAWNITAWREMIAAMRSAAEEHLREGVGRDHDIAAAWAIARYHLLCEALRQALERKASARPMSS